MAAQDFAAAERLSGTPVVSAAAEVVWDDLITTAAGLGVAILSVFPYNYFNLKIEAAALMIEKYATSLEIVYEKRKGKKESETGGEDLP